MAEIVPSILAADQENIAQEIARLAAAGVAMVHLDVMDGIFVPNTTFDERLIAELRPMTGMIFDTHLMVIEPSLHTAGYLEAGSDIITVHYEASSTIEEDLMALRETGVRVGLSIKPDTEVEEIEHLLRYLDVILIMSVEPGYGGQAFLPEVLPKIKRLKLLKQQGYYYNIEVDGGINRSNIALLTEAGADLLVMGTAFFREPDAVAALAEFRKLARYGEFED